MIEFSYTGTPVQRRRVALKLCSMLNEKQAAYGDAFGQSHKVFEILYPAGVTPEQMEGFLTTVRVVDKLFRLANKKDAFGEDPWRDIAGYALLEVCRNANKPKPTKQSGVEENADRWYTAGNTRD